MNDAAERLSRLIGAVPLRLADISDDDAAVQPAPGRWSKKEILGHLIDSAANNHQRFVRAQLAPELDFPGYEQEAWVAAQAYSQERWPDVVNLWLLLNRHLLHVMRAIPAEALARPCRIGAKPAIRLEEVITGYVDHLEHHLQQILGAA